MAVDLGSIIQALDEDPAQRAALRRAIFGDVPDLMSALASLTDRVDELAQAQQRTEARLEGLIARVDDLAQAQQRTEARLGELAEAQKRTEQSLNSLIDTVKGMNDKLARLDGESLERRYREKGHAYFSRVARRLRLLDGNTLSPLLDDAERAGILSSLDVDAVLWADAVFAGRRRHGDDEPIHLVVEASVTIDRHDVRRARERADLLALVVGTEVIPVVAGHMVPPPVVRAAQEAGAWTVTNGRAVSPEEDFEER